LNIPLASSGSFAMSLKLRNGTKWLMRVFCLLDRHSCSFSASFYRAEKNYPLFSGRFSICNGKMPIQSRINTLLCSMAAPDAKQLRHSSDQAKIVVFPDRSKF
jgi:hypothetical protein